MIAKVVWQLILTSAVISSLLIKRKTKTMRTMKIRITANVAFTIIKQMELLKKKLIIIIIITILLISPIFPMPRTTLMKTTTILPTIVSSSFTANEAKGVNSMIPMISLTLAFLLQHHSQHDPNQQFSYHSPIFHV